MLSPMSSVTPPLPRADSAASSLRQEILCGQIGPGNLLAESAVARRLGVSRVPVREALFTLEREGLVEFSPSGRAFVKELTPQDFEELYVLRLTLEPLAARLATPTLKENTDSLLANIKATEQARAIEEITRLDLDFHELILEASGNRRLLKLWQLSRSELELWLGRLHREHQQYTKQTQLETVNSHRDIVQLFQTESARVCERAVRQHILGWREWLPVCKQETE
jgi:DNA-binding GntR family transcriptional regulator